MVPKDELDMKSFDTAWASNRSAVVIHKIVFLHSLLTKEACACKPNFFMPFLNPLYTSHLRPPSTFLKFKLSQSTILPVNPVTTVFYMPKPSISNSPLPYPQYSQLQLSSKFLYFYIYLSRCSHTSISKYIHISATPIFLISFFYKNILSKIKNFHSFIRNYTELKFHGSCNQII